MPANSPNARQSSAYYDQLTDALLYANVNRLSYLNSAAYLNFIGVATPTGKTFTVEILKQLFKKLRKAETWPSYLHHHLMCAVFKGDLTVAQVQPLLQSRRIKAA